VAFADGGPCCERECLDRRVARGFRLDTWIEARLVRRRHATLGGAAIGTAGSLTCYDSLDGGILQVWRDRAFGFDFASLGLPLGIVDS
jgi:hypothetical protein